MESEDYPFFQGLVYLLENDVSTLGYELTFSTEVGVYSLRIFFFCLMEFNMFLKVLIEVLLRFNYLNP